MRNAGQVCVNGHLNLCISVEELQFAIGLLTQLEGRDLVAESERLRSISELLARLRDVTMNQSPSTLGEETEQ